MITRWKFGTPRLNGRITKPETKLTSLTELKFGSYLVGISVCSPVSAGTTWPIQI